MPNHRPLDVSAPAFRLPEAAWLPSGWPDLNLAIALSGGADSMALLRVLLQLKQQLGGTGQLLALHVNHQLRGAESAQDTQWCRQHCDSLGVALEVMTCETAQLATETGQGIEATARAQRYQLLTHSCQQAGVRYLATAHTRDDQVETILFRILRGTGLRGLAGIPPTRALTESLTLIRPLLGCSREMVLKYLMNLGQKYRTDSSNVDRQFTRNRLRHDLLPQLRANYNEELDSALLRLAEQAAATQEFVEQKAIELLAAAKVRTKPKTVGYAWNVFSHQPHAVVCEALRLAWREAGLAEQAMTFEWWRRLADLVQRPTDGAVLNLPGGVRASIAGEQLLLEW